MDAVAPMRIGYLTASISRQAGGLLWAVRSPVPGLMQSGCHIEVFSIEDRYSGEDAAHWGNIRLHVHKPQGPRSFGYAPKLDTALDEAELDLIHSHGLWMYPSVAAWRWGSRRRRPLMVSPHGMLDSWALRNSAWKKRLAGWAYENRHLRGAACLHALNDAEYVAIRDYGLSNPVAVIPNGVNLPDAELTWARPDWAFGLPESARVLLFLGRLHPKKGLAKLLRAWARLSHLSPGGTRGWYLAIAGWDQGGHEAELRCLVNGLDLRETVRFAGPQLGAGKSATLSFADAFILPSVSEGLPMAVLEAWAHCLPVLMTPQCNLPEGFAAGAAIEILPDAEGIANALVAFLNLSESEMLAMGLRGRKLAEERFDWHTISARIAEVYAWVLGRGPKPSCVRID